MDLIGLYFVFPDSACVVEQISHFNTWLILNLVSALFHIFPDAVLAASTYRSGIPAKVELAWSRMGTAIPFQSQR
jgi:hypothetical protein